VAYTLLRLGLWSPDRELLLTGTAIAETGLRAQRQEHGPALGFFQIEPATHDDVVNRELAKHPGLAVKVDSLRIFGAADVDLQFNAAYGVAIAAPRYLTTPEPIPHANSATAPTDDELLIFGGYWVRYYNRGGKARPDEFRDAWRAAFPASQPGASS
jgi:hypothetical protein